MIITTPDGKTVRYPFSSNACTGYRAEKIEMEPDDFRRMSQMLLSNPNGLRACLLQLEARFPPAEPITLKDRLIRATAERNAK